MPRAPGSASRSAESRRHNPLAEEYAPSGPLKQKASKKRKATQDDDDTTIDSKASRRILKIGRDLVEEEELEEAQAKPNPAFTFASRLEEEEEPYVADDDEEAWGDEDDDAIEDVEIDPNDQDIFNRFLPSASDPSLDPNNLSFSPSETKKEDAEQGTNLADLILEKIALHEAAQSSRDPNQATSPDDGLPPFDAGDNDEPSPIPEKVVAVYTTIAQLLSRQRSGALPKPFKILPTLPPEQIVPLLDLTDPTNWTAHVHLQSVRLFISAKPSIAQPYLTTMLLPRIRADIHETKKLHIHLYTALKKALYKPACFFKGLLFPLLEDASCTLREAQIISSVISRVSVPVLHSAAALLRLADIAAEQFTTSRRKDDDGAAGATNIFIRCLLEKKYALPYKVVDALVFHFLRFKALDDTGDADATMSGVDGPGAGASTGASAYKLTVLWHQSLLAFAQRYRNDITEDQREALLDLVAVKGHKSIGPEVRRELLAGRGRGVAVESGMEIEGGDDTMVAIG